MSEHWSASACQKGESVEVSFVRGGTATIRSSIDTEIEQVDIIKKDDRAVVLSWEGTECQVIRVLRLRDGKTIADTGCKNSTYCFVAKMPSAARECGGEIRCEDGGSGLLSESQFSLCE